MEWTAKYRPETVSDVRGNSSAIQDLQEWAESWNETGEAVILHGRPGIGKTTAAHALANDMGWNTVEMNASEQRTSDVVNKIAGSAANMGTLFQGSDGNRLVILDEADSLHGNTDRGGSGAMSDVVRDAAQPVVLIANDYYEMSRSLRDKCADIEFDLVDPSVITSFLEDIRAAEDVSATDEALEAIAESADGDVRGAVNDFQAVVNGVDGELTVSDLPTGSRDRKENIFEYLDSVFKSESPETVHGMIRQVDETPDDLFNWVEDNITKEYNGEELWNAYSSLARADEWLGRVRASQEYKYWKYVSDCISAGVAVGREGRHSGWTRWGPPSFWQKLGRTRGTRNTRDEIARQIGENSNVSMETAKNDLLPFLAAMTHHCKNRELTVSMTATYELDASTVSFITGSGEDTNKVASIVEDAENLRAETAGELIESARRESPGFAQESDNSLPESTDTVADSTEPDLVGTDNEHSDSSESDTEDASDASDSTDDDDDGLTQTTLFD